VGATHRKRCEDGGLHPPYSYATVAVRDINLDVVCLLLKPSGEAGGLAVDLKRAGQCRCGLIDTGKLRWFPISISRSPDRSPDNLRPSFLSKVLRKEVIQPQVPLRLPCYDLVPITGFIFGACLAAPTTSDAPRFGGLTGGVYKAQEHIHRRSADRRLLAIPASCGRVAARNPN
jgi:hypothetical protein